MLFTQFNMDDALAVRYEEGVEDGIEQGEYLLLIQLVQRKLQKGKTVEEIAEDLEEPLESVKRICKAVESCGTEDAAEIYKFLKNI